MNTSKERALRRAYLLGRVDEETCASLELAYFSHDGSFDELLILEGELIDEYVSGRLPRHDRRLFDERLQISSRLRRRVAFARALAEQVRQGTRSEALTGSSFGNWLRAAIGAARGPRFAIPAIVLLAISALVWVSQRSADNAGLRPSTIAASAVTTLPAAFEINRGQTDAAVRFVSRMASYSVFLTPTETVFALADMSSVLPRRPGASPAGSQTQSGVPERSRPSVIRMALAGARRVESPRGVTELPGKSHYFNGSEPADWITGVTRFARVEYDDVYDGIDVVYYGNQGRLEQDFIVAPGADPAAIALTFSGADRIELDSAGALNVWVGDQPLRWEPPIVYQERDGTRQPVPGAFERRADGSVGFAIGPHDRSRPLIIDPIVVYGTYLGGSGFEAAVEIAVDQDGAAYVTGVTTSADFPRAGAGRLRTGRGQYDAFVAKVTPDGKTLEYAAYLGGSGDENFGQSPGIAVDAHGAAYVTGWTDSTDFPVTRGALQTVAGATFTDRQTARVIDRWPIFGHDDIVCCPDGIPKDAFITKLSPDGSRLEYSTYLGRNFDDQGKSITVDASGHAYVVGYTASDEFPTTTGAFQRSRKGGSDIFAAKLSPDGAQLVYSTYVGGSGIDLGHPHAMDADGSLYIVGSTYSLDFPVLHGVQSINQGAPDGFVLKLDPSGGQLVYSTYLGGSGEDRVVDIALDATGSAYAAGYTRSPDFPLDTPSTGIRGTHAAFVTQLTPRGSTMTFSRLLDGADEDIASAVAVDPQGRVYVAGFTRSTDFPTSDNAFQTGHGGDDDAYLAVLERGGVELLFATLLGGARLDGGTTLAIDPARAVYVAGITDSPDFPVTRDALQPTHGAERDIFVMKVLFDWLEPKPRFRRDTTH